MARGMARREGNVKGGSAKGKAGCARAACSGMWLCVEEAFGAAQLEADKA